MEALKPKHAKKSRKPKRDERSESTPSLAARVSQSPTERSLAHAQLIHAPEVTDSEAQLSVETVINNTPPKPVEIFELPKEPISPSVEVPSPEASVPPPCEVVASAPPRNKVRASAAPTDKVVACAAPANENRSSVAPVNENKASAIDINASAPPEEEPLYCRIYPDLSTVDISGEEMNNEAETILFPEIDLPEGLTNEQRLSMFSSIGTDWLNQYEKWFINCEKMVDMQPKDNNRWSRMELLEKLKSYGILYHQLTGPFVEQRKTTQDKLTHLEDEIWRLEERVFEGTGVCQDRREVKAKVKRTFAVYDGSRGEAALKTLSNTLDEQIKEEKAASMERQYLRVELQNYFDKSDVDGLLEIIMVLAEVLRIEMVSQSCTLRKSCPYLRDLRSWFQLVCVRYTNNEGLLHRLFVLFQVLRLPGGIKSWAVQLVQFLPMRRTVQLSANANEALSFQELRETLIQVDVIMRPIAQRNSLFRSAGALDETEQFIWVDSDGEGDITVERMFYPLTEDDMNALLDQMPVQALLQTLKKCMLDTNCIYGIVITAMITQTLLNGCSTYGALDRYRNFTTRLGRLIHHTISYANWLLQKPLQRTQPYPLGLMQLVVEYDKFFYETVCRLYRVRSSGLWQYLVSLPFNMLTEPTLCRIFHELQSGKLGESCVSATRTPDHEQTENGLKELSDKEFYYVLQMMANIAVAQKKCTNRLKLVYEIAETLMMLLITVDQSEQLKMQYVLHQLRVVISNYPQLISTGLELFDGKRSMLVRLECAALQGNLLSAFNTNDLPLRQWVPKKRDIDVLLSWFEDFPLTAPLHMIAADLLRSIYYGDSSCRQLTVPREWQLEIVRKVVVTYRRFAETVSADQASRDNHTLVTFQQDCLHILLQCRVHAMDQPVADVQRTLQDPASALDERFVRHLSDEPALQSGIAVGCHVSSLAALLITTVGHWVPILCFDGLPLLQTLSRANNSCLVIRCLELVVPLVVSCPWSLTGNDQFLQLVRLLIEKESIHIRPVNQPSSSRSLLAHYTLRAMMITQIKQYRRYGFLSPAVLVKFWSECIVRACKDIATDVTGLSLLNDLAYSALTYRDAWEQMRQTLTPLLKNPAKPPRRSWGIVDQVVTMFRYASASALFLDIPLEHIALVLLAVEIEHDLVEVQTGLWPDLLCRLDADSSLAIQPALAQVGAALQLQFTPAPRMLVLYKAARVIALAEPTDPLFPLLCQRFFTILLARHERDVPFGVTERLLTVDVPLVVEVKKRLHLAEAHYTNLQRDASSGQGAQALYARLQSAFQMFAVWLTDRQLDRISAGDLHRLPAQFCVPRLKKVFAGQQDLWLDLVDWSVQTKKELKAQSYWVVKYRRQLEPPAVATNAVDNLEGVFQRRLESYKLPAPIPDVTCEDMKVLQSTLKLPFDMRMQLILCGLRKIDQHTERLYWPTIAEFKRLKQEILEKTKVLYTNESGTAREQAKCSIMCEGAGTVHIPVQVATRNEHVVQRLEDDRRDLASTVEAAIYLPPLILDEIVQCRMLWKSLMIDLTPNDEKTMLMRKMACLMELLRAAFKMLRDHTADHLEFAMKDGFLECFKSFPELAYTEVATLLKTTFKQRQKPPTTVTDLLHAEDIPIGPMKSIYEVLTTSINKTKQAVFIQLFGGDERFNLSHWLTNANADASDIASFITFTSRPLLMEGDERRHGTESADNYQKFYRIVIKHTIELAFHAFPVNFCQVLKVMLTSVVGKTATPSSMLVDLVNAIRLKLNLLPISLPMGDAELRAAHWAMAAENIALKEPFIQMADSVIQTITTFFGVQREAIGDSKGLYPHYQHRIREVSLLMGAFAHIYCMEKAKYKQLNCNTFKIVCELFEPWLVPYTARNVQTASWRTMPWNSESAELASHMLNTMVQVLLSWTKLVEMNSTSISIGTNEILYYVLDWYTGHFINLSVTETVLQPVHAALLTLAWGSLLPSTRLAEWLNVTYKNKLPEQIKFACHVFVKCAWQRSHRVWLDEAPITRQLLLLFCIDMASNGTVLDDKQLVNDVTRVLGDIAQLPWAEMDCVRYETSMDYYQCLLPPSIVLRSPTAPHRKLEEALLELLEIVSGFSSNTENPLKVDSIATVKRAYYIRIAMQQLMEVATMAKRTVAVTNVKQQVAETMRIMLGIIIRPLEAVLPEGGSADAHINVQLREARALLSAMVMGMRANNSLHQPFSTALIELLTSGMHASVRKPMAHGFLGVMKLFGESQANLMALIEVTLFSCLNAMANVVDGDIFSWAQALELVSEKVAKAWKPEVLAGDGHVLCLQLHFLAHWRDAARPSEDTSGPKLIQLRQLLRHMKNVKRETDLYHIYPLWVTMMYGLLTLAPTTPTASTKALVESFSEYLSLIGCSQRSWMDGIFNTLKVGKKIPALTQRIIALGLNCCIVIAYRTLQAPENEGNDSGTASGSAVDPTDSLRSLAAESDAVPIRDQVKELVASYPPQLEVDAAMALAVDICKDFDNRATRIVSTILDALGGH